MDSKEHKIIFLDVDGVLNTATTNGLEPRLLDRMALLLRTHDATVVFSSTWRYSSSWMAVRDALVERGVSHGVFVGGTPDLEGVGIGLYPPSCSHENRTHEILLWLFFNAANVPEECSFPYDKGKLQEGKVAESMYNCEQKMVISHFVAIDDLLLDLRSCYAKVSECVRGFYPSHFSAPPPTR